MKRTTLLLVLIGISIQITQAQVKEQYRDQDNASTVVVVKEDGASNIDILNSQFDLANVSMGEEIMIIMKDGKPVMVKSDGTPVNVNNDSTPAEPADEIFAGAEMPVDNTPEVVEEVEVQQEVIKASPVAQKVAEPVAKATTTKANTSKARAKSAPGTYPVKTKFKKKKVSRKAYKKRKGFSLFGKKGSSCYSF